MFVGVVLVGKEDESEDEGSWRRKGEEDGGWRAILAWPRRRTVSRGNRINSSMDAEMKVKMEYVVGDKTGSMPKRERRRRGVEEVMKVGRMLCITVMGSRLGGQLTMDRSLKEASVEWEREDTGVRISLRGTMSNISLQHKRQIKNVRRDIPCTNNVQGL